jgi:hypothetical protein
VNVVLGVWLFISAFLWPHSHAQLTNTWLMGVLCVLFALAAAYVSPARYLNALLAIWLFISAFALPHVSVGTVWNNAIVAVLIFVAALIPATGAAFHRPRPVR